MAFQVAHDSSTLPDLGSFSRCEFKDSQGHFPLAATCMNFTFLGGMQVGEAWCFLSEFHTQTEPGCTLDAAVLCLPWAVPLPTSQVGPSIRSTRTVALTGVRLIHGES